jgi:hypothetical protein
MLNTEENQVLEEDNLYENPFANKGFNTKKKKPTAKKPKAKNNIWGESPRELDILGISNLTKPRAAVKKQKSAQAPYEYNEQGYFVPKEEELSTWDKLKGYASELFESKDAPDGQLTYYDQAPVKQQATDYKKNAVDAINATGKYEFLKEYSKKDRAEFVSKLVPTPKYTKKVYNQGTNEYEIKPKEDVVEEIRKYLPKNLDAFESKESYDKAFSTAAKKFADNDPAIQYQKKLAQSKANNLAATKKTEIEKKYDLTNPINVDKANKELESYYKTILTKGLAESETLKVLNEDFNISVGGAAEEIAKEYGRSKDNFLSFVDNVKKWGKDKGFVGKAADLYATAGESVVKGVQNMSLGVKETLLSTNQGQIAELNNLYKGISDKPDTAPADRNLETFWKTNELSTFDPSEQDVPKTYGEAKARLKKYMSNTSSLVDERLQEVIKKKDYINLFDKADLKDGIQFSDVVKLVAENAPNMAISGAGALTGNPILLGLGAASMFTQEYGDQYYSAIETGLAEDLGREPSKQEIAAAINAGKYADRGEAAAWASISAGLEFASELNIIKNTTKALGLGTDAKKAMGSLFKGEIKAFGNAALNRGLNVGKSGLGEWMTEGVQTGISQVSKASQLNEDLGKYIDIDEIMESAKAGGIVGSVLPFAGGVASQSVIEIRNAARTVATKFDIESDLKRIDGFFTSAEKAINTKFENGELSEKEKQDELAELRNIRNTGFKMPKNLSVDAKSEAFDLLVEKRKLMSEIQDKDDALTVPQKERIKTINESLTELARNANVAETLDKNLSIAKRLAGERVIDGGVGKGSAMEIFETTSEAQEAIDNWAKANNEKSADISFVDGMAMLSNGQIIINKEVAAKTKAVNVGGHELLHRVLASTFNSLDTAKATELKDKFLSVLTTEERALLDKRLKPYSKEYLQNDPSEYITQFFEIVASKELKWTDKLSDTFAKIGDIVLKYFKQKGFTNLEFKDGKDVYDFIKSYNKDLRRGRLGFKAQGLLEQGQTMLASGNQMSKTIDERREELEEKLAQDEIDFDRFDKLMEDLDKEEAEAKNPKPKVEVKKEEKPVVDKEESDAEKIVKDNKGTVASDKVQAIYDSKGVDGAFDIIKLFKPIVSKLVDKRRDAPGFDKELLTDEIETGKNGLFDLIKAYDPNSGVPLAAYVNKYLPVRAIEASRRILAKEFSKEIDEGTTSYNDSMDDDYSFDSTLDEMREEEERQSGLINPLDMMGEKLSAEYSDAVSSVLEAMSEKEIASLTFAKLNDLAPEVTGRFFGIPTAKVTNAAANLATPEIAPIQKIIYDNRVKLIKLLPEGAILEGSPASESLIGTGLSIPRKIQAEFYDQKERLSKGAGLIPFELKKNITHRDFLAAFGIKEDGLGLAFGGKDPRAQTILAMIRLYGKIASNTAVRMTAMQSLEQQADLKAGASKMQFSQTVLEEAKDDLGIDPTEDPAEVNGKNKRYVNTFNTILNSYGYKDLDTLSDSVIGRTNFKADSLINHLKAVNELIKVFPNILANDIGLIKALLGLHYRTSGLSYNFVKNNYKKIIDKNGNIIKDVEKLNNIINLQSTETFNANVSTASSGISKDAKKILADIEKELFKLPAKDRKYTSINKTKLNKVKAIILDSPTNLDLIQENLNELAKLNAVNKKKAELYFENLRDWVHEKNIGKKEKAKRINSLGIIFSGNANIINGIRALSAITGAVIDTSGESTIYKVEHEDAIIKVMSNIFKSIVANEKNIEFNSTAILVPALFAKSRDKDIDVKLSNAAAYQGWKAKELSLPNNSNLKEISLQFSLSTKEELNWETSLGVTSADFKVDKYDYKISMASVKSYGLSSDPEYKGSFEKVAKNLKVDPDYITNNNKMLWVGFSEKNLGFEILNTGNAFEVLGIVTNGLADYATTNNLDGVAFDAKDPSRIRLYKTLASTIGARLGWNYSTEKTNREGAMLFVIAKPDSKQSQNKPGIKFSLSLSEKFNDILEETQGVGKNEEFSNITARTQGSGKGKFRFFVPPSAEDFSGLLYDFLGKGKKGEEHFEFFKTNLISPYTRGIQRIDNIRANIKEGYKALKAEYPAESKKLKKKVEGKDFTYDQAVRVYLWKANDIAVPGLSDKEVMAMSNTVKKNAQLREFADKLSVASGQLKGWVEPTEYWNVESIVSDLHNATEKIGRRNILGEFIENSEQIFSPENLNKIEAALGTNYRSALEDSLFRMKNGSNQTSTDKFSGGFVSWIANANGTIMFLNTRSAILQTISATNYLNWTDNNPVAASAAFLNQPQYWKDFAMIFNSNKLKERREGLKADVNEAEIANAVKGSKNKAKAALSYLLKIGYTPTQIADSFAIAAGGSTFYRNRVKTYEKQGLTTQEAEEKAFEDFDNATEESQQSSDPSKLSQQQASTAGRLILAFANTPMQYNRLMKKAFRDLINKRGDAKTHVSKILYYGAVQNIIFSALQNALFATLFDDEEEDEKTAKANERKYANILNGMADTILRGTGITGAIVSTAKNTLTRFFEEREKGFKGDQAKTIVAALGISPPIGSKAAKLYSAINTEKIDKDIIAKRGMDVTLDGQLNLSPSYDIAGKVVASTTNFPLDRVVDKVNNVAEVLDSRNKTWQRVALALGWKAFDVGTLNEGEDLIRAEAKAERKEATSIKTAKANILKKENLRKRIKEMSTEERAAYKDSLREIAIEKAGKRKRIWEQTESFRDSIKNARN